MTVLHFMSVSHRNKMSYFECNVSKVALTRIRSAVYVPAVCVRNPWERKTNRGTVGGRQVLVWCSGGKPLKEREKQSSMRSTDTPYSDSQQSAFLTLPG